MIFGGGELDVKFKQFHMVRMIIMAVVASWVLIDGRVVLAASGAPAKEGQSHLSAITHAKASGGQGTDHPKAAIATNDNGWAKFEARYGVHQAHPAGIGDALSAGRDKLDKITVVPEQLANQLKFSSDLNQPWTTGFVSDLAEQHYITPKVIRNYGLDHLWTTGFAPNSAERRFSTPLANMFAQGKLMFNLSLHDDETGQALFGLRLVFPFGS